MMGNGWHAYHCQRRLISLAHTLADVQQHCLGFHLVPLLLRLSTFCDEGDLLTS